MGDEYAIKRRKATIEETNANTPIEGIDAAEQAKALGLEEGVRRKQMLDDQCLMMDSIDKFIKIADEQPAYKNFMMVDGEPGMLMHDLVGKKEISPLFGLTPAQLSLLMPKIKLYKVYYDENNKKGTEKELIFPDHTSPTEIERITANKRGRGEGVGIKSFSYEFAGKNPAEGGIANCVLKLYFQDINTMLTEPDDPKQARFLDLLVPKIRSRDEEYFRIKVVAGWADPIDPKGILIDNKLRKKIRESNTVLFLNLVKHDIDYREDGSVEVTIEYRGAMEGAMSNNRSDLFIETEAEKRVKDLQNRLNRASKDDDIFRGEADSKMQKDIQYNIAIATAKDKQEKYSRLIRDIRDRGKVFYFDIDHTFIEDEEEDRERLQAKYGTTPGLTDQEADLYFKNIKEVQRKKAMKSLKVFRVKGNSRELQILLRNLGKVEKEEGKKLWLNYLKMSSEKHRENIDKIISQTFVDTTPTRLEKGKKRVTFVYAGDIIDSVLSRFYQNSRIGFQNMEAIVGSLSYQKVIKGDKQLKAVTESVNIANVPISLQLFIAWYTKEVIARQREHYYIGDFLKDFITKLIIPAVGRTCSVDFSNRRPEVSIGNVTVGGRGIRGDKPPIPRTPNGKTNIMEIRKATIGEKVLTDGTNKQINNLFHYFIIYATIDKPSQNLSGNFNDDLQKGIYHLTLGADKGLTKSIKFSKTDLAYEAEHRATSDTSDTEKLFDRYNATITMVGNNLFRPGIYVYIDTSLAGLSRNPRKSSISRTLGIGGYYQITKVEHVNSQDDYETVLDCQWITDGTGKIKPESHVIRQNANDRNKIGHVQRKVNLINYSEDRKKTFF